MYAIALYQAGVTPAAPLLVSPTFTITAKDRFGTAQTVTMRNLGGGIFAFDPTGTQEANGMGVIIDAGATATPRYSFASVGNKSIFFGSFSLSTGAPTAGGSYAIATYVNPDGTSPTIPAVTDLGGGLNVFTPSDLDRVMGTAYEGYTSSTTIGPVRFAGIVSDGVLSSTSPARVEAATIASATNPAPRQRDLSFDFKTLKFRQSGGDVLITADLDAIRQAVEILLKTFEGEWFLDTSAGVPYFQNILVKAPDLPTIRQILKARIEAVPGVVSVGKLDLIFDKSSRSLDVKWSANTDLGEISGTLVTP